MSSFLQVTSGDNEFLGDVFKKSWSVIVVMNGNYGKEGFISYLFYLLLLSLYRRNRL